MMETYPIYPNFIHKKFSVSKAIPISNKFDIWKSKIYSQIKDIDSFNYSEILTEGIEIANDISTLEDIAHDMKEKNTEFFSENRKLMKANELNYLLYMFKSFKKYDYFEDISSNKFEDCADRSTLEWPGEYIKNYINGYKKSQRINFNERSYLFQIVTKTILETIYDYRNELYSAREHYINSYFENRKSERELHDEIRSRNKKIRDLEDKLASPEFREKKVARNSKEVRQFRESVKERDSVCQCCGNSEELVAHHILPFNQYNFLGAELYNGITLCKNCHKRYHSQFGYGKDVNFITLAQFLKNFGK